MKRKERHLEDGIIIVRDQYIDDVNDDDNNNDDDINVLLIIARYSLLVNVLLYVKHKLYKYIL